jgi:hypothetical protein
MKSRGAALLLILALCAPAAAAAQHPDAAGWDAPRVLALVAAARDRRAEARADADLLDYETYAEGFVYFYLDREDTDELILIKVDQVALEVYWAAPDRTKQRIVGMRESSQLPNRQHYHIDHLTVVQDEFPDVIRIGDGDEVQAVAHPVAPAAEAVYSYRLSDSLTIRLPGALEPVRVYQIDVRPRFPERPGYVGSIFVDRATAALVRLTFTFTPASYVDRRLDYIRITLDNGLWEGRYWLPYEQRLEIRREVPELDFPAGSVIRGVFRIGEYTFNQGLPPAVFRGPSVIALPREMREQHAFQRGLFEGIDAEDLAPSAELARLEAQARELIGARLLSGLPAARLRLGSASSALRFNRAEGLYLGAGTTFALAGSLAHLKAGWALGAAHPVASLTARAVASPGVRPRLELYLNQPRDLGVVMPAPGVLNTFSATFLGRDWLDPYYASGAALALEQRAGATWVGRLLLEAERHHPAERTVESVPFSDELFRAVLPVDAGTRLSAALGASRDPGGLRTAGWTGDFVVRAGAWEGEAFLRPAARLALFRHWQDGRVHAEARMHASANLGALPVQHVFLLGGPGTLPGFAYRSFAGDRYALAELDLSREVLDPWLRLRLIGSLGWAAGDATAAEPLGIPTAGPRASAGVGVGLFYDILRLHLVRGLNGGDWGLLFSVRSAFEDLL